MKNRVAHLLLFLASASCFASVVPPHEVTQSKDNGPELTYFPMNDVPLFELRIVYDFGQKFDPPGKATLGSFTVAMLKKGSTGLDENQISGKIDGFSGGVSFSMDAHTASFSAYGLEAEYDKILALFFKLLEEPTFPQEQFDRMKLNQLEFLQRLPESPNDLTERVARLVTFNDSEFVRVGASFVKDLTAIHRDDLAVHYTRILNTPRPRILLIGTQAMKKRISSVIKRVKNLSCDTCDVEEDDLPTPQTTRFYSKDWDAKLGDDKVLLVDRPGIPDAYCVIQGIGPKRLIPEYYALRVAETVLGGYFLSRLNAEIREKRNLSYSVDGGFDFGRATGIFQVSTSTRVDQVGELLTELRKIVREFAKNGITANELQLARDYLSGAFPLGLQNRYALASNLFEGVMDGLPESFMDDFVPRVKAVTLSEVNSAIKRYVDPSKLRVIVVGDAEKLKPELKQTKMKIEQRDAKIFL